MKKTFIITVAVMSILLCGFIFMNQEKYVNEWNVNLVSEKCTPYGMNLHIYPKREYKNMDIVHEHFYEVHRLISEGVWVKIADVNFNYKGLEYNSDVEYKKGYSYKLDWSKEVGSLDSGQYKLALEFSAYSLDASDHYTKESDKTFEVEFMIGNGS